MGFFIGLPTWNQQQKNKLSSGWEKQNPLLLPALKFYPPYFKNGHSMKQLSQFFIFFLLLCFNSSLTAQTHFHCGEPCHAEDVHNELLKTDPDYFKKDQELEKIIQQKIKENQGKANKSGVTTYTIPVVVHMIHRTGTPIGTSENRSYADVVALLQGLNDDFAHASGITYPNPNYGVGTEIEFCLAARDPSGNPTDGIDRHADDDRTVYDRNNPSNNPVTGLQEMYHWTPTEYYNIYLIYNIIGAAGFAYFAPSHGQNYDGAVMEAGVSAGVWSHEVGHAMYLYHSFQDSCINNNCWQDGDRVCDTPPRGTSGFGGGSCGSPANTCDTDDDDLQTDNPYRPIAAGGLGDQVDMFENYMDYTSSCWSAFTIDQKDRMRWAIDTYRSSYLSSSACIPPVGDDAAAMAVYFRDTCGVAMIGANGVFGNFGSNTLTAVDVELYVDGVLQTTFNWTGSLAYGQLDTIEYAFVAAATGTRNVCVKVANPNGNTDGNILNDEICVDHFVDLYCPSEADNSVFMFIDSVAIVSVENQSGNDGGYANYTGMDFIGELGHPVNYHLTPGYSSTVYNVHWKMWCDLNQDNDFDDPGELLKTEAGNAPINGSFDIPTDATTGQTRFRIVMSFYSSTGATGIYAYGETEDYTIDIQPSGYVNDINVIGFTPMDSCAASYIGAEVIIQNVGSANLTTADIDLKIDASTVSTFSWSGNLAFGEKDTFEIPKVATSIAQHYLCILSEMPNGATDEFNGNDEKCQSIFVDSYCPLAINNPSLMWLDSISIGTIDTLTGNDGGYGQFINMATDMAIGHSIDFYLNPGYSSTQYNMYWSIWIDLNHDNDFNDIGEYNSFGRVNTPVSGMLLIHPTATVGSTRMRIGATLSLPPSDGKGSATFGEIEDYTVNLIDDGCYAIDTFPYTESFENGTSLWYQEQADDFDWTRDANGTPSSSTGPSAASDGTYYMYTEASAPNSPTKEAIIYSTCIDFTNLADAELTFGYHLYGQYMGTLEVEVSTDGGSTWSAPVWSQTGDQGNTWHQAVVDLSAYDGQVIQLRFDGTTGDSWSSDMAIDKIMIDGTVPVCPTDRNENGDPIATGTYEALNSINSNGGRVADMGNVIFQANGFIHLENNFTVDLGGIFEALIGGACGVFAPVEEEEE